MEQISFGLLIFFGLIYAYRKLMGYVNPFTGKWEPWND